MCCLLHASASQCSHRPHVQLHRRPISQSYSPAVLQHAIQKAPQPGWLPHCWPGCAEWQGQGFAGALADERSVRPCCRTNCSAWHASHCAIGGMTLHSCCLPAPHSQPPEGRCWPGHPWRGRQRRTAPPRCPRQRRCTGQKMQSGGRVEGMGGDGMASRRACSGGRRKWL